MGIICLLKDSQAIKVQKIFLAIFANRNKRSVCLLNDHFVINECELCYKEWKPLAMV